MCSPLLRLADVWCPARNAAHCRLSAASSTSACFTTSSQLGAACTQSAHTAVSVLHTRCSCQHLPAGTDSTCRSITASGTRTLAHIKAHC